MGLYDSICMEMKCPYCKEISEMEFQTKEGDYCMTNYHIGDKFQDGQFRVVDAIGGCRSLTCQFESAKESVWTNGYYGGFSRSFDVKIFCDSKGRITNKIKIYNLNHHKGIMKGVLGELKGKEDNLKLVKPMRFLKSGKITEAEYKPMITNGWLDKFKNDSFDDGKNTYQSILFLFNIEDCEEAMKLWFYFRYRLERIVLSLKKLNIKGDGELISLFLSNTPESITKFALSELNDGEKE